MDTSGLLEGYGHITIRVCASVFQVRLRQSIVDREGKIVWRCQLGHLDVLIAIKCEIESTGCTWSQ